MHTCDAIIVNYHTNTDLRACLTSFARHKPERLATLRVVQVNPRQGDIEFAHRVRDELGLDITMSSHAKNVGYGRACNDGADQGRADTVGFFNADTEITAGSFDACVEALWSQPGWGILGPRQRNRAGALTAAGIFGDVTKPRHRGWKRQSSDPQYHDVRDDAVYVAGSILFARREVMAVLALCGRGPGTFMLETPLYYEESWACRHALAHHWKCVYLGTEEMVHQHDQSPGSQKEKRAKMYAAKGQFIEACRAHDLSHE